MLKRLLLQVGMRANVEQLVTYKQRFPVPKFELPENIYTDDFDITEAEKVGFFKGFHRNPHKQIVGGREWPCMCF